MIFLFKFVSNSNWKFLFNNKSPLRISIFIKSLWLIALGISSNLFIWLSLIDKITSPFLRPALYAGESFKTSPISGERDLIPIKK